MIIEINGSITELSLVSSASRKNKRHIAILRSEFFSQNEYVTYNAANMKIAQSISTFPTVQQMSLRLFGYIKQKSSSIIEYI